MTTDQRAVEILKKCDLFKLYTFDEFMDYSPVGKGIIVNGSREPINVINRQIAATIAYLKTRNLNRTGRLLNLNHATIFHSVKKIHDYVMTKDRLFIDAVNDFKKNYNECKKIEFGIGYSVAMRTLEAQMIKEIKAKERKESEKKLNQLQRKIEEFKHEINHIKQTQCIN